jgi:hypothetical protein
MHDILSQIDLYPTKWEKQKIYHLYNFWVQKKEKMEWENQIMLFEMYDYVLKSESHFIQKGF